MDSQVQGLVSGKFKYKIRYKLSKTITSEEAMFV